jgi:NAD(P)-dependent dehydrogenase (short-subunit alcohol dehydrogenase family)
MVITGATGGIGKKLMGHLKLKPFDLRTDEFPETDVLINCMGTNYDALSFDSEPARWAKVIEVNLINTMDVIRLALPYMRNQSYGRIINLTSVVPYLGVMGTTAYSASKAGLDGMVRTLAIENANKNVLINNLALGYFDCGMTHRIPNYKELRAKIPIRKFGQVEDIVGAIWFLVENNYITGQTIHINGGLW